MVINVVLETMGVDPYNINLIYNINFEEIMMISIFVKNNSLIQLDKSLDLNCHPTIFFSLVLRSE